MVSKVDNERKSERDLRVQFKWSGKPTKCLQFAWIIWFLWAFVFLLINLKWNKWSLRSHSATIPQGPDCTDNDHAIDASWDVSSLNLSFWSAGKVPWILWLFLLPCDLSDQSQHLSDTAWKYPGLLFIAFKRLLVIMGREGMELIELYQSNLWIRIAIVTCLDRALFLHKSSYLDT